MKLLSFWSLLLFASITSGQYVYQGDLKLNDSLMAAPGSVSKNGNYFFLSVDSVGGKRNSLYYLKRRKLGAEFKKLRNVKGQFVNFESCSQPTLSKDRKTMVFMASMDNKWANNDLCIAVRKCTWKSFKNIRKLDELNEADKADAYPCLSPDALTLYYLKNNELYFVFRKSLNEKFCAPQELKFEGEQPESITSAWVHPNELEIYLVYNDHISWSIRKSKESKFTMPEEYISSKELGKDVDFISGVSFTNDMNEMFIYHSNSEAKQSIRWYKKSVNK